MSGRTIPTMMGSNLAGNYRRNLMAFGHMLLNRILGALLGSAIAATEYKPADVEEEATTFATTANAQILAYADLGGGSYRKRKTKQNHGSKSKKNRRSKSKSKSTRKNRGRR